MLLLLVYIELFLYPSDFLRYHRVCQPVLPLHLLSQLVKFDLKFIIYALEFRDKPVSKGVLLTIAFYEGTERFLIRDLL